MKTLWFWDFMLLSTSINLLNTALLPLSSGAFFYNFVTNYYFQFDPDSKKRLHLTPLIN